MIKDKYKMNIFFIICLITINCASSQVTPTDDCSFKFEKIGLRDFEVGTSLKDLREKNDFLALKYINDGIDLYDDYMFKEIANIDGIDKEVTYYFNVQKDIVVSYFFEFKGNIVFFNKLAEKLDDDKFIDFEENERKYHYFKKNEFCTKYFRLKIKREKMIITGGLDHRKQ